MPAKVLFFTEAEGKDLDYQIVTHDMRRADTAFFRSFAKN